MGDGIALVEVPFVAPCRGQRHLYVPVLEGASVQQVYEVQHRNVQRFVNIRGQQGDIARTIICSIVAEVLLFLWMLLFMGTKLACESPTGSITF